MKNIVLWFVIVASASVAGCGQLNAASRGGAAAPKAKVEASRELGPRASRTLSSPAASQQPQRPSALKLPLTNPRIVVLKSERRLQLYSNNVLVRTYHVGLGLNPVPDKQRQGDHATPEGEFYVFTKNNKSAFYLSLGVSYPNVEDAQRGLRDGLISRAQHDAIVKASKRKATPPQNTPLGGDIYIHGNGASSDWTWGCVALENADIRELFDAVPVGTAITIKP